jgi:hypothetical protein
MKPQTQLSHFRLLMMVHLKDLSLLSYSTTGNSWSKIDSDSDWICFSENGRKPIPYSESEWMLNVPMIVCREAKNEKGGIQIKRGSTQHSTYHYFFPFSLPRNTSPVPLSLPPLLIIFELIKTIELSLFCWRICSTPVCCSFNNLNKLFK